MTTTQRPGKGTDPGQEVVEEPQAPRYLNRTEFAAAMGVTDSRLRQLDRQDRLPDPNVLVGWYPTPTGRDASISGWSHARVVAYAKDTGRMDENGNLIQLGPGRRPKTAMETADDGAFIKPMAWRFETVKLLSTRDVGRLYGHSDTDGWRITKLPGFPRPVALIGLEVHNQVAGFGYEEVVRFGLQWGRLDPEDPRFKHLAKLAR